MYRSATVFLRLGTLLVVVLKGNQKGTAAICFEVNPPQHEYLLLFIDPCQQC